MSDVIHALSWDFLSLPGLYTEQEDQVAVNMQLAFSVVFTAYLSNAVISGKSPNARIVLKPLASLIGRLVA